MLSDRRIRALKPAPRDKWYCDGNGLYLRVRRTGGRSWVLRRKRGGHVEVITVGAWPALGLAQARLKAGALAGKDVSTLTLGALLDTWHTDVVRKTYRRPHEVRGYIERLDPALKVTKLRNLERVEVRHALRRYAEERGPIAANRALSILKTALRFAVDAGYLEISPVDRLSNELVGGAETSRDRVLTDEELRRLWQASSTHTPLLRFLLLTGQRIGEAQRATWSHVLGGRWHIPKEHSKNHRAHWVALSRQALALLRGQDQSRELIFGTATDTGVQAWLRRWCERERISPAFRPHDLRRTCATRLNTLGVLPHVTEKILNHTMQGVMAVYNRAEYEAERIEAMQRWADELDRILGQSAPLNEARGATQERPTAPGGRASRAARRLNP
jgi:integrase